ncbi:MAG TPA: hypothetical protein VM347_07915, partial [Nonomuraea sp.]|nr:hypothetical protein [Nonomuraea sp.]
MGHFEDEVEVVADGATYTCWARLRSWQESITTRSFGGTDVLPGKTDWNGRLDTGSADAALAIYEADERRLRADRESGFTIREGSDFDAGELLIRGSGDVPFDD